MDIYEHFDLDPKSLTHEQLVTAYEDLRNKAVEMDGRINELEGEQQESFTEE